jgi:hypothetical protein
MHLIVKFKSMLFKIEKLVVEFHFFCIKIEERRYLKL